MRPLPLRTPSLVIRHLVPEDSPSMLLLNAEETTRRWLPSHVYADAREAADRLAYLIACYVHPADPRLGAYVLGVEHGESGALLGHVGFSPLGCDVEISYAIAERARGRGFGAEAVAHACAWASDSFGLRTIVAITDPANVASCRMLERGGFRFVQSEVMRFQGMGEQAVCRYAWIAPRDGVAPA